MSLLGRRLRLLLAAACTLAGLPAHAGPMQCTGELVLPDGERVGVTGWGDAAAAARTSVEQAARFLAAQHLSHSLTPALMTWDSAPEAVDVDLGGAEAPLRVPGYSLVTGGCSRWKAPEPGVSARWGDGEAVRRHSPAVAVEAARRRGCVVRFQLAFDEVWHATAHAPAEDKTAAFRTGAAEAWSRLAACYADPSYTLEPASVEAPHTGAAECTVWQWGRAGQLEARATAYGGGTGPTLEAAAHAALQDDLSTATLDALQIALTVASRDRGEMRQARVANTVTRSSALVRGADRLDRSDLVCTLDAAPAALPGVLDRGTHEAARDALRAGYDARDLDVVVMVLPGLIAHTSPPALRRSADIELWAYVAAAMSDPPGIGLDRPPEWVDARSGWVLVEPVP